MSNVNYTGSLAQRFMNFNSTLQSTVTEESIDLFNTIMVWVPASLAAANIADYSGSGLTEDKPIVKTVTSDNYNEVMKGTLLSQWKHLFRDGANVDATIYLVVFYDTGFAVELGKETIANNAMSKAFKKLYNLAYTKTLFFEDYTGKASKGEEPYNTVSPYFDMALCLAALCENEHKLSMFRAYYKPDLSLIDTSTFEDTNLCLALSKTNVEEEKAATTFLETTVEQRAQYFWGYLKLIGGRRTTITVHNGVYVDPFVLGTWMSRKNDSRTYIGNKLAKIKLTDPLIKPTGLPNIIEEDVNDNLDAKIAKRADEKNIAYLLSISDASQNNSMIIDDKTVTGFPVTADMMAKYIDYTSSQALAEFSAALSTLDNPVLANRETYSYIQTLVSNVLQKMAKSGRLSNIALSFPPYEEAKKGNKFVGSACWSARYVDDLDGVNISGEISF